MIQLVILFYFPPTYLELIVLHSSCFSAAARCCHVGTHTLLCKGLNCFLFKYAVTAFWFWQHSHITLTHGIHMMQHRIHSGRFCFTGETQSSETTYTCWQCNYIELWLMTEGGKNSPDRENIQWPLENRDWLWLRFDTIIIHVSGSIYLNKNYRTSFNMIMFAMIEKNIFEQLFCRSKPKGCICLLVHPVNTKHGFDVGPTLYKCYTKLCLLGRKQRLPFFFTRLYSSNIFMVFSWA